MSQGRQYPGGEPAAAAPKSGEVDNTGTPRRFTATNVGPDTMAPGCPVVVAASGAKKGCARELELAGVAGLIVAATGAGAVAFVHPAGPFELTTAQWDAVTGQVGGLTQGKEYFLSLTTGMLTTGAPTGIGSCVVSVGRSISPTVLAVTIGSVTQLEAVEDLGDLAARVVRLEALATDLITLLLASGADLPERALSFLEGT